MSEKRFPWRTLFFVSLAVNLLVLGAIGGALGSGARLQREEAPEAVVARIPGVRAFIAAVPPETRPQLRRELGESWRETRDLRRAALEARRDAIAASEAEPYDIERARAAFAAMRSADQAVVGVFHENMAQFLATLSVEQRRDVMQRLRQAPPATRQSLAPVVEEQEGAVAPEPALTPEQRQNLRERLRERRQEMRERRQQGGQ